MAKINKSEIGNSVAMFQFFYGHVPAGKHEIESIDTHEHYSDRSKKTTKVFKAKLKGIPLEVFVLPTRAVEGGLAQFEGDDIVWKAQNMEKKTVQSGDTKETYFQMS